MNYFIRLMDVCLAAYFLVTLGLELAAVAVAPGAVRLAERMRPARGARMLFGLRLSPLAIALVAVLAFCVPSFLRFEEDGAESVGLVCSVLALCGLATLLASAVRVAWGVMISARLLREKQGGATFSLVGFLRPRVIVAEGIREALSSAQMEVALRHETAHLHARDNLKRLAMFAAPRVLPQGLWHGLEAQWGRLTEWAADDAAIAGEPRRALALAEALVCVARLSGERRTYSFISSLVPRADELGQRVQRILAARSTAAAVVLPQWNARAAVAAAVAGLCVVAVIAQRSNLLYQVHCVMERLVH